MTKFSEIFLKCLISSMICTGLVSCARDLHPSNPLDPYEHFNRGTYAFNQQIDKVIYKPIATAYSTILPWPAKKGISNILDNLGEVTNCANSILQLNAKGIAVSFSRLFINTTVGIGGLFDVAAKMGMPSQYQDLGLTFAKWGAKQSPYFVLPFLGPSSIRDAIAFPINYFFLSPWSYIRSPEIDWSLQILKLIDMRAKLLPGDQIIEESFDQYAFVRDAYLQRRDSLLTGSFSPQHDPFVAIGGDPQMPARFATPQRK